MEGIEIFRKKKKTRIGKKLVEFDKQDTKRIITSRRDTLSRLIIKSTDSKKEELAAKFQLNRDILDQLDIQIDENHYKNVKNKTELEKKVDANITQYESNLKNIVIQEYEENEKIDDGLTERKIRILFDDNKVKFQSVDPTDEKKIQYADPTKFIRRYSEESEYKILPDIMEEDYDDIPDENGLSKYEVLRIIQMFSERISEIKNQERGLYSKLDCAVYTEQYLDTMDQIASLYRKKLFPKSATDYFANHFGYGINLMNWYFKFLLDFKYNGEDIKEFDPDDDITQLGIENEEDRWIDFRWICRGEKNGKNRITKFKNADKAGSKFSETTLPLTMYQYEELPEEAGIKPDEVLEIMREFSNSLIELTDKETKLKTQIDCAVYAETYLDILDQIAYLINTKALVTDSSTFFENNFSFGLTLKIWYDLEVAGADGQEGRWNEFLRYCKNFQDDDYNYKVLTAFSVKDVLPVAMLCINDLPIDLTENKTVDYPKDKKGKLMLPEIYYKWEKYYKKWVVDQKEIVIEKEEDLENRESIEKCIKNFDELWKESEGESAKFDELWKH